MSLRVHGSAVAIAGRGVLILGASGRGKSDLALRLIDRGAVLIADDQVALTPRGGILHADAIATIHGKIEVRGLGILDLDAAGPAPIALVVDLDAVPERLPEARTLDLGGVAIPVIALPPFDASTAVKVELALKRFGLPLEGRPS